MAVKDKLISNEALKPVYDNLNGKVGDLKSAVELDSLISISYSNDGTGFINQNTGEVGPTSAYYHTDYVDLTGYTSITYKRVGITTSSSAAVAGGMAFYNADKSYNSGIQAVRSQSALGYYGDYTIDIPDGAQFARFSVLPDTYGAFELSGVSKLSDEINKINTTLSTLVNKTEFGVLRFYSESTATGQSTIIYFNGGNAISENIIVNRVHAEIVHPSGAVSDDTRGVGINLFGLGKDGSAISMLANRSIFPQNHSSAHKMMLVFDLFTLPYKIVGRVDYYVDDVYSRSYDVNLTSNSELAGIYSIGGYFNTGDSTSKTYVRSGVLYQNGSVIA